MDAVGEFAFDRVLSAVATRAAAGTGWFSSVSSGGELLLLCLLNQRSCVFVVCTETFEAGHPLYHFSPDVRSGMFLLPKLVMSSFVLEALSFR